MTAGLPGRDKQLHSLWLRLVLISPVLVSVRKLLPAARGVNCARQVKLG
jgi:hypothetical protein